MALLIAAIGAVGRWWRVPGVALFPLQVLVCVLVGALLLTGDVVPIGHGWHELVRDFANAYTSSVKYASPVPPNVAQITPLLLAGGVGAVLLVDLLACTMHRVPLAGLPLLAVFSVPVSLLGHGLSSLVFILTAFGFMALLYLHEHDQVARWGRSLGPGGKDAFEPGGLGAGGRGLRRSAGSIGGVATVLAVTLPALVPTVSLSIFDFGPGNGPGGSGISVKNPIADLRRDLQQGPDTDLLQIETTDPNPSYLRIAVLNRFSGNQWSSGNRDIPTDQLANGLMPALQGVADSVPRTTYTEDITVSNDFKSTWLPTQSPITKITAPGDWRYDTGTMDFISGDKHLTTAGLHYDLTAVALQYDERSLDLAPLALDLEDEYTDLPSGLPPIVSRLATQVTRSAKTPFQQAVALQEWFREKGGFHYDLRTSLGDGTDDLTRFLTQGPDGRRGYCQQFAAAMAVMARELGIPARVAVGFLAPEKVGKDTFVYSAHDMHAWPELYFPGSGWVRFEPTPADRAATAPSYTNIAVDITNPPTSGVPTNGASASPRASFSGKPTGVEQEPSRQTAKPRTDQGSPILVPLLLLAALAVAAVTVLVPVLVRRRRRSRHLAGGPEGVWVELRDTALDLRLGWPRDRSPRETRAWLAEHVGGETEEVRAALGSLDTLVLALERARYSRSADVPGGDGLRVAGEACVTAMYAGASPRSRRRATWRPASVISRAARRRIRSARSTPADVGSGMVDALD